MCGRFALRAPKAKIIAKFGLKDEMVLKPRFNIAPTQVIPIIRTPHHMEFLSWGLKPKWLKENQNGFINARVETILEKVSFKKAFKKQRCLIVSDGYYEWQQKGERKQPYFIEQESSELFAFAGIWDNDSCAILTKDCIDESLKIIHNRMPVIINEIHYQDWLLPTTKEKQLLEMLCLKDINKFKSYPVSTHVNNPKNDDLSCVVPL